ncbi:MAG: chromophore lyase CpcT/CpeT [Phycisphaerales bacterium]|nr:chromophore lyase CpcT/CpeT [Phycisphaerales bacterium]
MLLSLVGSPAGAEEPPDLSTLLQWMSGSFSSEQQHHDDPENFLDIRLRMIPIWQHRADGCWLYVEQARAEAQDRPYRQRVYQLLQHLNGELESRVYELPGEGPRDVLRFAGAWRDPQKLDGLTPDQLKLREGCSILLTRTADGHFEGGTRGKGCASSLQGAVYTTSEVRIYADRLITWDRGWDENDRQVWGARKGGYVFVRTKE